MDKRLEVWDSNLSWDYTILLNNIMKTKKKQIDWRIVCTGIISLVGLEAYALYLGHNGLLLTGVMTIIGLAIGVTIENPFKIK